MDGITNLGVPRGTGPGGQRRRGLGAGRRGMVSVSDRDTWKTRSYQHSMLVAESWIQTVDAEDGCFVA